MSLTLTCSSCHRELRVPVELVGRLVKCPACGLTFATGSATDAPNAKVGIQDVGRSSLPDLDSEEYFEDAHEGEFELSPRQKARFYRAALDEIRGPAIALMIVGIINCILGILRIGLSVWIMAMHELEQRNRPEFDSMQPMMIFAGVSGIIIAILGIVAGAFVIYGAIKMRKLKGYRWAMASSILAMIPVISFCCILGLPFGIWSIVVLCKPDVKDAFS